MDNQQPGRVNKTTLLAELQSGMNAHFKEWQKARAGGHTHHTEYHAWLEERIDDNRRLAKELSEDKDKRPLTNSLEGWGRGLNRPAKTKLLMRKDTEEVTHMPIEGNLLFNTSSCLGTAEGARSSLRDDQQ
jgi:hypothetical protein